MDGNKSTLAQQIAQAAEVEVVVTRKSQGPCSADACPARGQPGRFFSLFRSDKNERG